MVWCSPKVNYTYHLLAKFRSKITRSNLFTFISIVGFLSLLFYLIQPVSVTHYYSLKSVEQVKSSRNSFNPVRCHKCGTNKHESEALDPRHWIPQEPFVYYRAFGGLGNQLFEYACAYTIAKKNKIPLLVYADPKPGSDVPGFKLNHGDFALHLFNIPLPLYDPTDVHIIGDYIDEAINNSRVDALSDGVILAQDYKITDKILRLNDYCQSELFFRPYKEEIVKFYKPKMLRRSAIFKWKEMIARVDENYDSVAIHVRRGDYTYTDGRLVNESFYFAAMDEIRQRLKPMGKAPVFFIFSDDIAAVQENFKQGLAAEYYEHLQWVSDSEKTLVEDLYLMSQCRHNILSGSSFGWWGAYLNEFPEKIIIASHFKEELFKDDPFHNFLYRHTYYPIEWFVKEAQFAN